MIIEEITRELLGDNKYAAASRLRKLGQGGLPVEEAKAALKAATLPGIERGELFDHCKLFIEAAAATGFDGFERAVAKDFDAYSERGRAAVLEALAQRTRAETAHTLAQLVGRLPSSRADTLPISLARRPDFVHVLFPALFAPWVAGQRLDADAGRLVQVAVSNRLLSPELRRAGERFVLDRLRSCWPELLAAQGSADADWPFSSDYFYRRLRCIILLEVLGALKPDGALEVCRPFAGIADPDLACVAATTLIRLGEEPGPDQLLRIAARADVRSMLFDELGKLGRADLFPPAFADQAALAEGEMVRWLCFPNELGQPPREIVCEVVLEEPDDAGGPTQLFFLFRFSSPHHPPDQWFAGMAGPYSEGVLATHAAWTFSRFDPWDSRSPEEHAIAIADNVEAFRKAHNARQAEET